MTKKQNPLFAGGRYLLAIDKCKAPTKQQAGFTVKIDKKGKPRRHYNPYVGADEIRVAHWLAGRRDFTGNFQNDWWDPIDEIAKDCRVSRRAVLRALKSLKDLGYQTSKNRFDEHTGLQRATIHTLTDKFFREYAETLGLDYEKTMAEHPINLPVTDRHTGDDGPAHRGRRTGTGNTFMEIPKEQYLQNNPSYLPSSKADEPETAKGRKEGFKTGVSLSLVGGTDIPTEVEADVLRYVQAKLRKPRGGAHFLETWRSSPWIESEWLKGQADWFAAHPEVEWFAEVGKTKSISRLFDADKVRALLGDAVRKFIHDRKYDPIERSVASIPEQYPSLRSEVESRLRAIYAARKDEQERAEAEIARLDAETRAIEDARQERAKVTSIRVKPPQDKQWR